MNHDSFPPANVLGYGIDMTSLDLLRLPMVTSSLLRASRLIHVNSPTGGIRQKVKNDVYWTLPEGISVTSNNVSKSNLLLYRSGNEAADALKKQRSSAAEFTILSGDASVDIALSKQFKLECQYAIFNFRHTLLEVHLEKYQHQILRDVATRNLLTSLPVFNPQDPSVVRRYKDIFKYFGSHVITGARYGGNFQLNVWASRSSSLNQANFGTNIQAAFNGITSGGHFDVKIRESEEHKIFEERMEWSCACIGGDPALNAKLTSGLTTRDSFCRYQDWITTAMARPDLSSVHTQSLWDIMNMTFDPELTARASDIEKAYYYFVPELDLPLTSTVRCIFEFRSDWAELLLLSQGAKIRIDSENPPSEKIVFTEKSLRWSSGGLFTKLCMFYFLLENDGSPVQIRMSHSDWGRQVGDSSGWCSATISGRTYEAKWIAFDDNNITEFTCHVPV
ncbi:hypothetical protein EV426DRAFT_701811 [Tirmania nivea]|nr:hypothetical protein EV426DRAFT_701811 [Tirmania nivea]